MVNAYPSNSKSKARATDFRAWRVPVYEPPIPAANTNLPKVANDNLVACFDKLPGRLSGVMRIAKRLRPTLPFLVGETLLDYIRYKVSPMIQGDWFPDGVGWTLHHTCDNGLPINAVAIGHPSNGCFTWQAGADYLAPNPPAVADYERRIGFVYKRFVIGGDRWDTVKVYTRPNNGPTTLKREMKGGLEADEDFQPLLDAIASLDPMALPPGAPVEVPIPPPFSALPLRDKMRRLSGWPERSTSGPNAARRPFGKRMAPQPDRAPPLVLAGPSIRWSDMTYQYKPSGPEKKVLVKGPKVILTALHYGTETLDAVNALYQAVDGWKPSHLSPQDKLKWIWDHRDNFNGAKALINLTAEYGMDYFAGKAASRVNKYMKDSGMHEMWGQITPTRRFAWVLDMQDQMRQDAEYAERERYRQELKAYREYQKERNQHGE